MQQQRSNSQLHQIIRLPKVRQVTSLSRSTLYEKMNPKSKYYDKKFPKPIKLGANSVGWYEHEVYEWLAEKALDRGC